MRYFGMPSGLWALCEKSFLTLASGRPYCDCGYKRKGWLEAR